MIKFPARAYNDVMAAIRRGKPLRGVGSIIRETSAGVLIAGNLPPPDWNHPWRLHPRWLVDAKGTGQWGVTITPGFVNGADVVMGTDDSALSLNPAPVQKITAFRDATGVGGTYPAMFKKLGARQPDQLDPFIAAALNAPNPDDPAILDTTATVEVPLIPQQYGTKRLMAADIILNIDHSGVTTLTTFADPDTGNLVIHSPGFTAAMDRYPYRIQTTSQYTPVQYPTMLERMQGSAVEPNFDQLLLGTLWLLSPDDEADDTLPGSTWQPYPQHFVFWNLCYGGVNEFNYTSQQPITIHTGLAFGLLDSIGNSMLAPINDAMQDVMNGLNETSMQGYFWTL